MTSPTLLQPKQRLVSLDFFRGLTVACMILVNNPGDWAHIYAPLEHSKWNGCTPTDLIFPSFLFMVGVSITYAIGSKKDSNTAQGKILLVALKRSVILYIIFAVLSLTARLPSFDLTHFRLLGVLPRIAIVFFITVVLFLKTSYRTQWWLLFSILVVYYILMNFIPVPGVGYANLEPGTNLGAWLDRTILGTNHIWQGSKIFDPEGILSTLPAIGTCLMGVLTGTWLRRKDRDENVKVAWLFTFGIFSMLAGLVCDSFFPINKALWTSSFVLYAGGFSMLALTIAYWLIDVNHRNKYITPFLAFGANAITAYVSADAILILLDLIKINLNGNKVGAQQYLYQTLFVPNFSPVNASLAGAVTYVLLLLIPMYILYKKKICLKV